MRDASCATSATASRAGASKTIDAEELVELTVVPTELEAIELCGYLAESGVEAESEAGGSENWLEATDEGAHRVLVAPGDLPRARELLDEARSWVPSVRQVQ